MEQDDAGEIAMADGSNDSDTNNNPNTIHTNTESDEGPALLHSTVQPPEPHDGMINHNYSSVARCANAECSISELNEDIKYVHDNIE